ncbi:MAG: DUF4350 domain-containing protein [Candidatus Hodarchaeales archaeon]
MNILKNSSIILLITIFLVSVNSNPSNIRIVLVNGVVDPTTETEIVIGIDIGHNNNITASQLTNLTKILNETFSTEHVKLFDDEFKSFELSDIDVLLILAPTSSYTDDEVELLNDFIKKGNSLFLASGFRNQTNEPINDISNLFGLNFNLSSSLIPTSARNPGENQSSQYFILAQNFTTPVTPLTVNVSQIMCPNPVGLSLNHSAISEYQSPDIIFDNPILLKNIDEESSENNTIASTLEFENGARILAIGSSDMFNNSFIEPLGNDTTIFLDNTAFIMNAFRWLGKNTGIMKFYDPLVDLDDLSVNVGAVIHGNVTLVDSLNRSLSQGKVSIALERTGRILSSRAMQIDPNNSSKYFGWVSTESLSYGYCDVLFVANRVGYLPIEITAGRLYLKSPFPSPILPDLALWGLVFAVAVLFFGTAVLVRMNLKQIEES